MEKTTDLRLEFKTDKLVHAFSSIYQ